MRGTSPLIRLLLVLGLVMATSVVLAPQASANTKTATSAHQVYTTTGTWAFNGRTWKTNCTKYSSTVDRCRTEIWATITVYEGGRFVNRAQWAFNNLTYKNSPRSTWEEFNPLVTPGEHTVDGRRWKTECNTAWTGQNACRSQIWATVPELKSGRWQNVNKWVFNNIVHLTPLNCPVTEKELANIEKEPTVITRCLQSKIDSKWLAVEFPRSDAKKNVYTTTAFFQRKSGGWALEAKGSVSVQSICDYYKAALPHAHDLADSISYCFSG